MRHAPVQATQNIDSYDKEPRLDSQRCRRRRAPDLRKAPLCAGANNDQMAHSFTALDRFRFNPLTIKLAIRKINVLASVLA